MTVNTHVYPYENSFHDDAKFNVNNIIGVIAGAESADIEIKISSSSEFKKNINNSIDTFKINEVYKAHSKFAEELISKTQTYNRFYNTELKNTLKITDSFKLEQLIYGSQLCEEDYRHQSLSKLKTDILKQLKVY